MNGATREQVMIALLAQLQKQCGRAFNTYSRAFIPIADLWRQLGTNQQQASGTLPLFPALFLYDGVGFGGSGIDEWQQRKNSRGIPYIRTLERTIVIYARKTGAGLPSGPTGDPTISPGSTNLQNLTETVENALTAYDNAVDRYLSLGGLVQHCWIEGHGVMIPGDTDPSGLGMQTLPIKIMMP